MTKELILMRSFNLKHIREISRKKFFKVYSNFCKEEECKDSVGGGERLEDLLRQIVF
jgi:hypothetical protein